MIGVFLLVLGTVWPAEAQKKKSKQKKAPPISLQGQWYGTFQLPSGTTYQMSMTIYQDDQDKLSGYQYWPEYYNSKSSIVGSIKGEDISIIEKELIQGYHMTMSEAVKVKYLAPDTLLLTSVDAYGKSRGISELVRASILPAGKIEEFQEMAQSNAEKYGSAEILSEHTTSSLDEIIEKNIETFSDQQGIVQTWHITGKAISGKLTMDLISHVKEPNRYHYEYRVGDLVMINARNDSIIWDYNGLDDKVFITEPTSRDNLLSKGLDEINPKDFSGYTLHDVKLDSLETVRIYLEDSLDNWMVYYVNKENFTVVRRESDLGVETFLDHQDFNGILVSTKMLNASLDDQATYLVDHVEFGISIADTLFDIPEDLQSKIEVNPEKDDEYYNEIGDKAFTDKKYEEARDAYSQAIKQEGYIEYYLKRGQAHMELGDYYEGISDFTVVLGVEPNNVQALNYRGLSKYYLQDYKNALKDLNKAIAADSNKVEAHLNRLLSHIKLKEFENAVIDGKRLIEIRPDSGKYHLYYGVTLAQVKKYQEAVDQYNQALALNYSGEGLFNYKGVSHYALAQYDSAAVYFELAYESDTTNTTVINNLLNSHYQLDEYGKAVEYMIKYLLIDPSSHDMMNSLGYTLYLIEDYDESLRYLNEAISLHKGSASYFNNRAQTYYAMDRYMEAHEDLNTSIDLNSENAAAFYTRGLIKVTMNNKYDACRDFKKAFEMGHEEAEAKMSEYCISLETDQ